MAILFSILAMILFLITDARVNQLTNMVEKKIDYNKRIDSAIDDGIYHLVELDSSRNIVLNKEVAVEQFLNSLYANFHILGLSALETKLKLYIPIIVITDMDGFYIYYTDSFYDQGVSYVSSKWSEKIPYDYEENNIIYNFTMSDYLRLYDKNKNCRLEGVYKELSKQYPKTILEDDTVFDLVRRETIIGHIEEYMNYYINHHNKIAEQYGITYRFVLPQIDQADWYQTIDDISMLVIFQGYPYTENGTDTYNRYALGGARISKNKLYYVEKSLDSEVYYYHKEECNYLLKKQQVYMTKEECALQGAFPCPECNP